MVLAALALLGMFVPIDNFRRMDVAVLDALHLPAFAGLTGILWFTTRRWLPESQPWAMAVLCIGMTIAGIAIETLQQAVGRSASWHDAFSNASGAAVFCLLWSACQSRRLGWRWIFLFSTIGVVLMAWRKPTVALVDVARQQMAMPLAGSFEDELEMSRWRFFSAQGNRTTGFSTDGDWSVRVATRRRKKSGIALVYPLADWTEYSSLSCDVLLECSEPVTFWLAIYDDHQKVHKLKPYSRTYELEAGQHRLTLDWRREASEKDGPFDQLDVQQLRFIVERASSDAVFYLDNVRLHK